MLKVVKSDCEYRIPSNRLVSVKETYDGVLITMNDKTELRFEIPLTPAVKAILPMVENSSLTGNVVFDLDAAIRNQTNKILSIS